MYNSKFTYFIGNNLSFWILLYCIYLIFDMEQGTVPPSWHCFPSLSSCHVFCPLCTSLSYKLSIWAFQYFWPAAWLFASFSVSNADFPRLLEAKQKGPVCLSPSYLVVFSHNHLAFSIFQLNIRRFNLFRPHKYFLFFRRLPRIFLF